MRPVSKPEWRGLSSAFKIEGDSGVMDFRLDGLNKVLWARYV
jgi:hypothetical protein